jgi:hypothetical protein
MSLKVLVTRKEWIAALDTIESLKPVAAIAGHKRPGAPDTPDNIEATQKYIRDFDRIASLTKTAIAVQTDAYALSRANQSRGLMEFVNSH